ncbi:TIGR03013 family XrtA/PEP-CTERM system glycosyltransferase [Uliginosibacterium sp. sgz301328]|uniref:TIGR03013 family XrtA/PEP-CTERM system glycosyltransferase n=1 Tax=Uliginosibacterium sp. sgz301328 TaxID=3243764 RepID=UPI00359E9A5B
MLRLFNHYFPTNAVFQVLVDTIVLFLAIVVAAFATSDGSASLGVIGPSALFFAIVMLIVGTALGFYRSQRERSVRILLARVALTLVISIPIAYGVFHVLPWGHMEHEALDAIVVMLLGAVLLARSLARGKPLSAPWSRRVLVMGTGVEAASVAQTMQHSSNAGLSIVGFYPVPGADDQQVHPSEVLPARRTLLQTVADLEVDEIIIAVRERRGGALPLAQLLDCKLAGVKVLDLSCFFERVRGQVRVDTLRASWLIYGEGFRQGFLRTQIKRLFDLSAAIVLLLLAAPVMLLTMIAIYIEDGGPMLYTQERVGQGGRLFSVIKFRSMRSDAESDGKPRWAQTNDSRVTRVGRIIRKARIDELPQLFNVLVGDMSMVGPRPERQFFVDQLTAQIPFYSVRHSVKPGVTGWAQVRYQYGASVDDAVQKLQYDLYYVKNHTLFLDLMVLAETVRVVMTGEGAH